MKIRIANDIRIDNPNYAITSYCEKKLTIDNPDYITAERVGRYTGNIEKKIKLYAKVGSSYILPFGTLRDIWKLKDADTTYELNFHQFNGSFMEGNINLYDYQEKALNGLILGKNGILQAPCGAGKTQIGLQLIKSIGGRALWLTHTGELLNQSKERCEMYFKGDFGTITKGQVNIGKDITFATVQTMSKIDPSIYKDEFDIVIVDECHHCVGGPTKVMQFYKVLTNCNARYKYGLSATLNRSDNLICSVLYILGEVLYTIPESDVKDKIIKAEHRKIDIDIDYDMREYLDVDGTINNTKLLTMLSNHTQRNKIILDNVIKNKGHKQLILCHRVNQCEYLYEILKEYMSCNLVVGKINHNKRVFDGEVIIATYSLAKEGLDIPELDILHLATPQKNEATTRQAVGRIERNIEGKKTPICYDYVDINISYCVNCYVKRRRFLNKNKKK